MRNNKLTKHLAKLLPEPFKAKWELKNTIEGLLAVTDIKDKRKYKLLCKTVGNYFEKFIENNSQLQFFYMDFDKFKGQDEVKLGVKHYVRMLYFPPENSRKNK